MTKILELKNVEIGYSDKSLIKDINASIEQGEFVILLAKNGQGKSTLSETVLGIKSPILGTINLANQDLKHISLQERAEIMSAVFSKLHFVPTIKVKELIELGRLPHQQKYNFIDHTDKTFIDEIIKFVEIESFIDSYADELSEGQLQLVMIARALIQDTPFLILDEPTANLDIENQIKIFKLIKKINREKQKSILFITHEAQLALQFADKIWWIENQKLVEGFPEDLSFDFKILHQLSGGQLIYDLKSDNYQLNLNQFDKQSNVLSELKYWIKHAMIRLSINYEPSLLEEIHLEKNTIRFRDQHFDRIEALVKYIQEHEKYYYNRSK